MSNLPYVGELTAPFSILLLMIIFAALRFENQRWIRSIASGKAGSSSVMPLVANLTGLLAVLVIIAVYVILIWKAGVMVALGTFVANLIAGLLLSAMLSVVFRGDSFTIWIAATFALWPVGYFLLLSIYNEYLG